MSKTEYPYTLTDTMNLDNGITYAYDYPTSGWRDKLCAYNGVECGDYDALGNPRSYRGATLTWSHGRRLDSMSGNGSEVEYKYNASGVRIGKTVNGTKTTIYLDGTAVIAQETDGIVTYFNCGVDGPASFEQGGNVYFYKRNILGDVLAIIDENNAEIAKYVYDAWGNHKTYVLDCGAYVEEPTTEQGQSYLSIAQSNPFRYRGYYYDVESGLYYLNTRYYDPEIGRFINADDISEADPETLNGLNLFAYCANNPVMNTDFMGTSTASAFESWFENIGRKIKSAFQKVGTWFKNTFGGAVKKVYNIASGGVDFILGGYQFGITDESYSIGASKPITFFVELTNNSKDLPNASIGMSLNTGRFSATVKLGLLESELSIGYGDTSVQFFAGLNKTGIGISTNKDGVVTYNKYYIRVIPLAFAGALVYSIGSLLATVFGTIGLLI